MEERLHRDITPSTESSDQSVDEEDKYDAEHNDTESTKTIHARIDENCFLKSVILVLVPRV